MLFASKLQPGGCSPRLQCPAAADYIADAPGTPHSVAVRQRLLCLRTPLLPTQTDFDRIGRIVRAAAILAAAG